MKSALLLTLAGLGALVPLASAAPQSKYCGTLSGDAATVDMVADGQCHSLGLKSTIKGSVSGGCGCNFFDDAHCGGSPSAIALGPLSGDSVSDIPTAGSYSCHVQVQPNTLTAAIDSGPVGKVILTKDLGVYSNTSANTAKTSRVRMVADDDQYVIMCKDPNYQGGCWWLGDAYACMDPSHWFPELANAISSLVVYGYQCSFINDPGHGCHVKDANGNFLVAGNGGIAPVPVLGSDWDNRITCYRCF